MIDEWMDGWMELHLFLGGEVRCYTCDLPYTRVEMAAPIMGANQNMYCWFFQFPL